MKRPSQFAAVIAMLFVTTVAVAADAKQHAHDQLVSVGVEAPTSDIGPGAEEAVAAVERFSAALAASRFDAVAAELAPDVLILEGGGAERSATEYLSGHARSDAAFLRNANTRLVRRVARVSGQFAWVGSEAEVRVQKGGKTLNLRSAETVLLQQRDGVWKIVHIHWSSQNQAPAT